MALDPNNDREYDPKGLDTYNYDYDTHSILGWRMWVAKFIDVLWFSAGADRQLLSKCPHSERVKYMGLGGVVLATALLAFSSGSYAFFTVFGPKIGGVFDASQQSLSIFNSFDYLIAVFESLAAGLLWALVIFNLDRFIVTSTGHGDGTEKITKEEFKNGLPRIILAIVVAICVAKPLEIRIFKTELDNEIAVAQTERENTLKQNTEDEFKKTSTEINDRINQLRSEIQDKESETRDWEEKAHREVTGVANKSTTGVAGAGRVYQEVKGQADKIKQENDLIVEHNRSLIDEEIKKLDLVKLERKKGEKAAHDRAIQMDGLALRIKLSHEHFPLESFFLMLMLIFIEITPVFIKMQFIIGPYDYLLENQKHIVMAKYGIQERYQTVTDDNGKPHQELMPIYHVADSIADYEISKLNVEKSLVKTAHKIFQEKVSNEIISKPEKFMPDLKQKEKDRKKQKN